MFWSSSFSDHVIDHAHVSLMFAWCRQWGLSTGRRSAWQCAGSAEFDEGMPCASELRVVHGEGPGASGRDGSQVVSQGSNWGTPSIECIISSNERPSMFRGPLFWETQYVVNWWIVVDDKDWLRMDSGCWWLARSFGCWSSHVLALLESWKAKHSWEERPGRSFRNSMRFTLWSTFLEAKNHHFWWVNHWSTIYCKRWIFHFQLNLPECIGPHEDSRP